MLSCLFAFFCRKMYGGALHDPNGILPLKAAVFGCRLSIDLNLAAEAVALLMLLAIVGLFRN
jgi:hypothetical protein